VKKIFISSTFSDLKEHRRKLWDLLTTYNIEISGMEEFGARNEPSLETCIKEVLKTDIYIGIIGFRYGSIDKKTNKSYTEIEYLNALNSGKEILIYLIDDVNCKISPSCIDFVNHDKLNKFKSKLKEAHTIDTFIDKDDLVKKIDKKIKSILPKESIIKGFRPKEINCSLHYINNLEKNKLIIIAYINDIPEEIYFFDNLNSVSISKGISKGWIIEQKINNEIYRYDFRYIDYDGYNVIIEGVDRRYFYREALILRKLLALKQPMNSILDIYEDICNISKNDFPKELLNELKAIFL
jgi:hypothetical protein